MFDRILTLLEESIITLGLSIATLLMFANVVARYGFNTGFSWVLEAVTYLMAWVVLIGAAHGFKSGIHLGVDILVQKLPDTARHWTVLLSVALSLFFTLYCFVLSIDYVHNIYRWGDLSLELEMPQWIPYLALPVGLGLMSLRIAQLGWKVWKGEATHLSESERDLAMNAPEEVQ